MNDIPWIVRSSSDPQKVSATIKGLLVGLIPVIIVLTGLTESEVGSLVDNIAVFTTAATTIISVGWTLYGTIRKVLNKRWASD